MNGTPVGLSRDLAAKHVMRAEVQGQDVAVWRGPDGELHAWNNRCPHRGMRLSHGFVRGDMLACLYHGWHYGKDGGCAYIPAHPDLDPPATISAQVYYVAEASGVIWVDTAAPPQMPQATQSVAPLRSLAFSCTRDAALAAFATTPFGADVPERVGDTEMKVGERRLWVYANAHGLATTMVHVCADAEATLQQLKALSRWCQLVRQNAEARNS